MRPQQFRPEFCRVAKPPTRIGKKIFSQNTESFNLALRVQIASESVSPCAQTHDFHLGRGGASPPITFKNYIRYSKKHRFTPVNSAKNGSKKGSNRTKIDPDHILWPNNT
jgi:hypothetical protein